MVHSGQRQAIRSETHPARSSRARRFGTVATGLWNGQSGRRKTPLGEASLHRFARGRILSKLRRSARRPSPCLQDTTMEPARGRVSRDRSQVVKRSVDCMTVPSRPPNPRPGACTQVEGSVSVRSGGKWFFRASHGTGQQKPSRLPGPIVSTSGNRTLDRDIMLRTLRARPFILLPCNSRGSQP